MLPVPGAAVPLSVPLRPVPLAVLSRRLAEEGEGEESGHATGNVIDRFAVAADAAGTTDRAHQPLRVTGNEGTRASALTCPITGVKGQCNARHERFLRMNSIYYIYADLLPVLAQLLDSSFCCGLNRKFSQPKE